MLLKLKSRQQQIAKADLNILGFESSADLRTSAPPYPSINRTLYERTDQRDVGCLRCRRLDEVLKDKRHADPLLLPNALNVTFWKSLCCEFSVAPSLSDIRFGRNFHYCLCRICKPLSRLLTTIDTNSTNNPCSAGALTSGVTFSIPDEDLVGWTIELKQLHSAQHLWRKSPVLNLPPSYY